MAERGLPHAHILLWLKNKLSSNEIDKFYLCRDPRFWDMAEYNYMYKYDEAKIEIDYSNLQLDEAKMEIDYSNLQLDVNYLCK